MTENIKLGKLILGNIKFSNLIKNAYKNYKEVEDSINIRLKNLSFGKNIYFVSKNKSFGDNYKQNFFTFIMLSILDSVGTKKEKLLKYGELIFCLRAIITATDNIIDNEEKGVIFISKVDNKIVENTLLILIMEHIMRDVLEELDSTKASSHMIFILNKIYSIAESESVRNINLYENYPKEDYIINHIHKGIGGELLQLSLWIPTLIEQNQILDKYSKALFYIGMSLQALDDLCDMQEDYDNKKINLAISGLKYNFFDNIDNLFSKDSSKLIYEFPKFYKDYVSICIDKAMCGFRQFARCGYPLKEKEALILLEYLFELRGIKELWDISKKKIVNFQ
jgi:hypothetical protein